MASMSLSFLDCFQGYPSGLITGRYTQGDGSLVTETNAASAFNGEQVYACGSNVYVSFSATSQYVLAGYKGTIGTFSFSRIIQIIDSGLGALLYLEVQPDGSLKLKRGSTTYATSPPGILTVNSTCVVEIAAKLLLASSVEVRVNGLRVATLTTTDWTASGGQPAGTLAAPDLSGNQASAVNIGGALQRLGYFYQKTGSALWKSIATGTAVIGDLSDFAGDAIRSCRRVVANGATYPLSGSDWVDSGGGTNDAAMAAACGETLADSDTRYLSNSVFPESGANKGKVSFDYDNLPGTASVVLAMQRNIVARAAGAGTLSQLRTYWRTGGVNNADSPDITLVAGAYRIYPRPYSVSPSGAILTPTLHNAFEGVTELFALTP